MVRSRRALLALTALGAGTLLAAPAMADPDSFSGPHIGIETEYLWGKVDPKGFANAGDMPIPSYDSGAALGGFTLGYDVQMHGFVLGAYGSMAFGKVQKNSPLTTLTIQGGEGVTLERHGFSTDLTLLAQVGARAGVVVGKNLLVYAKGGVAFSKLRIDETGDNAAASRDTSPTGYIAGVGADFRLSKNLILGISWEHLDLGDQSFAPAAYGSGSVGFSGDTGKLALKFKF